MNHQTDTYKLPNGVGIADLKGYVGYASDPDRTNF